ncbi:hypothetical protein DYU11_30915 [Fibrisoma montanum]|uniref:Uncharacterized protein n=1 Tax=Fibrisoma montanum TaxID=2305895 RepID=A0A418LWP2_9BACT|nr:hypothetical protein [Fibrisoma montanum]RIV17658.1 hypothetical protein DYU11_30915 [Fibrisoma montanum]
MKRLAYQLLLLSPLWAACRPDTALPTSFTDEPGVIELVVCSRGCVQYVLQTETGGEAARMFVVNMPDSLKVAAIPSAYADNQLPVVFSGTRTNELMQVNTAGPTDVPEPAYKAYRFQLTGVRRR